MDVDDGSNMYSYFGSRGPDAHPAGRKGKDVLNLRN